MDVNSRHITLVRNEPDLAIALMCCVGILENEKAGRVIVTGVPYYRSFILTEPGFRLCTWISTGIFSISGSFKIGLFDTRSDAVRIRNFSSHV